MSNLLEADELVDLTQMPSWDDQVECTSRSPHGCTTEAAYRSTCSTACPDPIRSVFWCAARYRKHEVWARNGLNCTYCHRDVSTCWAVRPLRGVQQ